MSLKQGVMLMRTFDFAPLYRSTVGFDRIFSMLDQLDGVEGSASSYPHYSIERSGENAYRISVAVAGFTDADLSIETKGEQAGDPRREADQRRGEDRRRALPGHCRAGLRSFQLADHVAVKGASLENGLLHVDLLRGIPEAMKPRVIPIASFSKLLEVKPTKVAA
jgi:molecular chaperone IbpA